MQGRIFRLVACGCCVAPMFAWADGKPPDPRKLGVTEAILDYCTTANAPSTDKLRLQVANLTRGVDPETLAKVRASDAYRQARGAEEDFISKVDSHNVWRVCGKPVAAKK